MRHIEIDLGDSGLRYQPGDALGAGTRTSPQLVKELVEPTLSVNQKITGRNSEKDGAPYRNRPR
ncbi:hypothetical protein BIT31_26845 [Klebsiella pneumoniae]|nr:hypothetical protein BIT31_26845 [Klebsiella pneumoniae]